MPSKAYNRWSNAAQKALDEIEAAHRAVEGAGVGRRYATLQINHAYAILISSQFQGFCRDLHSEAVAYVVNCTKPRGVRLALEFAMTQARKLDLGNPNPGNIGSDFARLGMQFWSDVESTDARNVRRRVALEQLNRWRNAIAHQDWTQVGGRARLQLKTVQRWRSVCRALAHSFDLAVSRHIATVTRYSPW